MCLSRTSTIVSYQAGKRDLKWSNVEPLSCSLKVEPLSLVSRPSSSGLQKCQNEPATGLECRWCLQWDCQPGHFNPELPYCYSYTWSPNDDFRPESDNYVEECSSSSCCEDSCECFTIVSIECFDVGCTRSLDRDWFTNNVERHGFLLPSFSANDTKTR